MGVPTQFPPEHWSGAVHAFPSSQLVPSGAFAAPEHKPVLWLQVPATWH
jgi:hypothetical protein